MIRLGILAALVAASTFMAACSGGRSAVGESEADRLLRELENHYASTPDLTIEGTMNISGVPAKIWFDAFLKERDSLKILLTGPFGIPVGALSATPATLEFFSAQENAVFVGRPDRETFRKMILIDIEYQEIAALLRGEVPTLPERGSYTTEQSGSQITYTVERGQVTERFTVDIDDVAVLDYRRTRGRGDNLTTELSINYQNLRRVGERMMPYKANVEIADARQKIWITLESAVDRIDNGQSFVLDIPRGIERRQM